MDNNFYETRRQPRVRPVSEKAKPKNIMNNIIIIQLVLSIAVSGLLFAVCGKDTILSQNIKAFYAELCEDDMTNSQILATFKKVAQFTFAPSTEWDGTFAVDEETTKQETEQQGETATEMGEKVSFSPVFLTVNFMKPIRSNNITSAFGYRISPITNKYSCHTGVDIAAPSGTLISAAYDGVVETAAYNSVRGNYVVIKHSDNVITSYNHCSELFVEEGMKIKRGETVALVGSTGASTGPHLHFEVQINGKYVNPLWVI